MSLRTTWLLRFMLAAAAAVVALVRDRAWLPADAGEACPADAGWAGEATLRREAEERWFELNRDHRPVAPGHGRPHSEVSPPPLRLAISW